MFRHTFISFLLVMNLFSQAQKIYSYPVTDKITVSDEYFGQKIEDPYRWLEDDRSEKTGEWVKKQNYTTEKYFSQVAVREKINKRLNELWNYNKESAPFKKGNFYFCYKNNGLQNQSVLFIKKSLEDPGKILLDPNKLSEDGTISLSGISVSKDGKTLAYGLSKAGSDWTEIHFKNIESGKELKDILKWVKFSRMSWKGNGIYYSRYDEPSGSALSQKNQFHKVYYHQLGHSQNEDLLIHQDPEHANYNFSADVSEDENFLYLYTSESTSGDKLAIKDLRDPESKFIVISDNFQNEYSIIENTGSVFYMKTNREAPMYKLVSFDLEHGDPGAWKTILPAKDALLETVNFCNGSILASYLENVNSHLYVFTTEGKPVTEIRLPGICRLNALHAENNNKIATYSIVSFTFPEQNFMLSADKWQSKSIFKPKISLKSEDLITEQVFFPGKDGTKIPMFITRRKDLVMNQNTPCFIFGYGGFNISLAPEFRIDRAVFIEAGGIYCVPNIRGGGEFGENWHKDGTLCKKQNVFDDFIAACEFLVAKKYTSHKKIAIHGRSNGGLLIGAVMTQRPDICKVAIPTVGVLDMLRFHLFTIGRAWTVDYGSSENPEQFKCLLKYSPYHNLNPNRYPATLILTGDHDDRVVPAHSFKFAAALQEKNKGQEPALIRIDVNAGHGAGKPTAKQIAEFTDMWSFVFYNLQLDLN